MINKTQSSNYTENCRTSRTPPCFSLTKAAKGLLGIFALSSAQSSEALQLRCEDPPGIHKSGKSPIYGNRNWEVQKIADSPFLPLFERFADRFYHDNSFRFFIRKQGDTEKCAPFADAFLARSIEKYAPYNCTNANIFENQEAKLGRHKNYVKILDDDKIQIVTSPDYTPSCQTEEQCHGSFPSFYSLSKYHELTHAEEQPYPKALKSSRELFSTLKQHIATDLILKECHGEDKDSTVDYGKTLTSENIRFPAGELANFYRRLEKSYGSLSEALTSPESIAYLMGDPKYQEVIAIIQKYPGSKLAAKKARACLETRDYNSNLIALSAMPGLIHRRQYQEAFGLIEKCLNNKTLFLDDFFYFIEDFIEAAEYEMAAKLLIKGLKIRFINTDQVSTFTKKLIQRENNWDRALELAMIALQHKEDEIQENGIQIAEILIENGQYDQAFAIANEALKKERIFSLRKEANKLSLKFIQKGQYEKAFQIILKSIQDLDTDIVSEAAIENLAANGYKIEDLLDACRLILGKADISSEERKQIKLFGLKLKARNNLFISLKDAKDSLPGGFCTENQIEISDQAVEIGTHALKQDRLEIQGKAFIIAKNLIRAERYDEALDLIKKGLESSFSNIRLKFGELTLSFIQIEKVQYSFQVIMKSLEDLDFDSIQMDALEYLFKISYKDIPQILRFVDSLKQRQDLSSEIQDKLHQFIDAIERIQQTVELADSL